MAPPEDLIDFDIIETHKENIQSLPSGRSARALATLYSPLSQKNSPPSHTQNLNDIIRQEYEKELISIAESDDPLDIYDRYVKWTLDAYPSAQATPQSQLLPLLERATKAFLNSPHYLNDPRYLKLWLHYIRFFSDAPRETYAFLARHSIGDGLALYYEEFAAWLEGAGRWTQAEEVYKLGLEQEARPVERLMRKFGEFQKRCENRPHSVDEPTSPALPLVRPALATKVDPFSTTTASPTNPQAQDRARAITTASKSGKQKLTVFTDDGNSEGLRLSESSKGWESIGSLAERKKENTVQAKAWAGETLRVGKRNIGVPKLMIYKDESIANESSIERNPMREHQRYMNPRTGKTEHVFVDLEAVYPCYRGQPGIEYCFEELRAKYRGWHDCDWKAMKRDEAMAQKQQPLEEEVLKATIASLTKRPQQTIPLNDVTDENTPPSQEELEKAKIAKKLRREERANRTRKIRVMEVRGETQTIQINLASPTGAKPQRKKSVDPTMTLHTREAMNEIYDIFNQTLTKPGEIHDASERIESDSDDGYSSAAESTATGRISASEYGDDTAADFTIKTSINEDDVGDDEDSRTEGEWSEFTLSKHVPSLNEGLPDTDSGEATTNLAKGGNDKDIRTGSSDLNQHEQHVAPTDPVSAPLLTRYIPIPPESLDIPTRPYRDPIQAANNRLPFMTPIVEKTESSLGFATSIVEKDDFAAKSPCRKSGSKTPTIPEIEDNGLLSSPFQEVLGEVVKPKAKVLPPTLAKSTKIGATQGNIDTPESEQKKEAVQRGIINDTQCNPVDEQIRQTILANIHPPLSAYEGYSSRKSTAFGRSAEIRRFAKLLSQSRRLGSDRGGAPNPILHFESSNRNYIVKRELGKGAFAPVYLVESILASPSHIDEHLVTEMGNGFFASNHRRDLEALKAEDPPEASEWEYYILHLVQRRLSSHRASASIIRAYELHLFRDEAYLIEEYRDQGTLLDLVNLMKVESGTGVMDEMLVMWFTIELFRTVGALHGKGIIHGDLKSDNVLVRLDQPAAGEEWNSQYDPEGKNGWTSKGIALIDFGRGIDMRAFRPDVQFIADWKTTEADCAEMREMRPWTYQIDYHGLAGIVHNLLFGTYIDTVAERGAALCQGVTKKHRIKEMLKRYWQTEIWSKVFDLLLNPLAHTEIEEGRKLPVVRRMKELRETMEHWLVRNCERGVGLKGMVRRMEERIRERRR